MIIMTRKRFEEELDRAAAKAKVEVWKEDRIDKIENDVDDIADKIKELESKVDSLHSSSNGIWRRIDDIQNELTRIPKCD